MLSPKVTRTETAISGRRLSSVEPEEVTAGGRGTWSLRHNDLSAVGEIPRSMEAWRSGRSKSTESTSLVTTMGSEDARLASPAFLLGKILQGERVSGTACKEIALQTKSIPSRAATTQGACGCDVARVAGAAWGAHPTLRRWVAPCCMKRVCLASADECPSLFAILISV